MCNNVDLTCSPQSPSGVTTDATVGGAGVNVESKMNGCNKELQPPAQTAARIANRINFLMSVILNGYLHLPQHRDNIRCLLSDIIQRAYWAQQLPVPQQPGMFLSMNQSIIPQQHQQPQPQPQSQQQRPQQQGPTPMQPMASAAQLPPVPKEPGIFPSMNQPTMPQQLQQPHQKRQPQQEQPQPQGPTLMQQMISLVQQLQVSQQSSMNLPTMPQQLQQPQPHQQQPQQQDLTPMQQMASVAQQSPVPQQPGIFPNMNQPTMPQQLQQPQHQPQPQQEQPQQQGSILMQQLISLAQQLQVPQQSSMNLPTMPQQLQQPQPHQQQPQQQDLTPMQQMASVAQQSPVPQQPGMFPGMNQSTMPQQLQQPQHQPQLQQEQPQQQSPMLHMAPMQMGMNQPSLPQQPQQPQPQWYLNQQMAPTQLGGPRYDQGPPPNAVPPNAGSPTVALQGMHRNQFIELLRADARQLHGAPLIMQLQQGRSAPQQQSQNQQQPKGMNQNCGGQQMTPQLKQQLPGLMANMSLQQQRVQPGSATPPYMQQAPNVTMNTMGPIGGDVQNQTAPPYWQTAGKPGPVNVGGVGQTNVDLHLNQWIQNQLALNTSMRQLTQQQLQHTKQLSEQQLQHAKQQLQHAKQHFEQQLQHAKQQLQHAKQQLQHGQQQLQQKLEQKMQQAQQLPSHDQQKIGEEQKDHGSSSKIDEVKAIRLLVERNIGARNDGTGRETILQIIDILFSCGSQQNPCRHQSPPCYGSTLQQHILGEVDVKLLSDLLECMLRSMNHVTREESIKQIFNFLYHRAPAAAPAIAAAAGHVCGQATSHKPELRCTPAAATEARSDGLAAEHVPESAADDEHAESAADYGHAVSAADDGRLVYAADDRRSVYTLYDRRSARHAVMFERRLNELKNFKAKK